MIAFSPFLVPLFILLFFLVLLGVLFVLGRIAGGKYLRSVMQFLMKVPLLGKALQKMSRAALERQNPELASAVKKLERLNANASPQRAQAALGQLSSEERRAYMDAVQEQGAMPEATNRAMRRQMQKQKRRR
jgi:2-oxo-4-hydroxy-4-carboxy--5-ureidoimidazoline (OHCU) decarboxylase